MLEEAEQQKLHKMGTDRARGRLMKAGYDEETVFSLDRPELLEELAKVMLAEAETVQYPAEGGSELTELQVGLMELEKSVEKSEKSVKLSVSSSRPNLSRNHKT